MKLFGHPLLIKLSAVKLLFLFSPDFNYTRLRLNLSALSLQFSTKVVQSGSLANRVSHTKLVLSIIAAYTKVVERRGREGESEGEGGAEKPSLVMEMT